MRVLITGGTGLLGQSLIDSRNHLDKIVATYVGNYTPVDIRNVKYLKLDVRNFQGHTDLFEEYSPDVVVHTAGIGSPDYAEQNREESWDVNIGGTNNMLALCEKHNARLIYISSNGIYDGEKAPYDENDTPEPVNYYGELKLEGEGLLQNSKTPCSIVRPILMYGWNNAFERPNIAVYALSKLSKGERVQVYDDTFSTPLFSNSCAEAIWRIIEEEKYDVFNIAGAERASIYQMILKMAKIFGLDTNLVEAVQQGFFNELVQRPRDTSFRTNKMEHVLKLKPLSLHAGFSAMKLLKT